MPLTVYGFRKRQVESTEDKMSDDVTMFTNDDQYDNGNSVGIPRPPSDSPQKIQKQSWANRYVDPTRQPVHILLYDTFNGVGGYKGDINPESDISDGTYSYIDPMSTELQWPNRVKQTKYYNYLARYVNSMVNPVFSQGNIETITKFNGDVKDDDALMSLFMKNCDGTGTKYDATQKMALQNLRVHDVAYYAMTKKANKDIPSLSVFRAVDLISSKGDEDGLLVDVKFFRGTEYITDGETVRVKVKAIQYFFDGVTCKIQKWHSIVGKDDRITLGNWADMEWEKEDGVIDTDVGEMVVYAHLPIASPIGEFLPQNPSIRGILDACLGLYQDESKVNWLFALHNLPTPVIWGDIIGMLGGAGQAIAVDNKDPNKGYAPKPDYMSVDSGLLPASMEKLQFNIERLRELAKENGVDTKTGSQAQSGDSKRYEFEATEQKLRGSVDMARDMDEWIFRMFNIYTGRSDVYEYYRTYPDSFYPEEEATTDELEMVIRLYGEYELTGSRNVLLKELFKKVSGKTVSKEDAQIVLEEIEKSTLVSSELD